MPKQNLKAKQNLKRNSHMYIIQGKLTHNTVVRHLNDIEKIEGDWQINGEKITVADSAAVALLLSLRRLAKQKNKKLTFHALPESILQLASMGGVHALIEND